MAAAPSWNLKCILFTAALAGGYWHLPPRNKWVLLALLYAPYAAMAWYDEFYDCRRDRFRPTFLSLFYGWLKPADYARKLARFERESPGWHAAIWAVDLALLAVLIAAAPAFARWRP